MSSEGLRQFGVNISDDSLKELRDQLEQSDKLTYERHRPTIRSPRKVGREGIRSTVQIPAEQEGEYND